MNTIESEQASNKDNNNSMDESDTNIHLSQGGNLGANSHDLSIPLNQEGYQQKPDSNEAIVIDGTVNNTPCTMLYTSIIYPFLEKEREYI